MALTSKERSQKYRDGKRDGEVNVTVKVTTSVTGTARVITLLKRPNGADYDPEELMPDGTLRYMGPFTDGQVLDNKTVGLGLTPGNHVAMKAWATATLFTPTKYAQAANAVK